MNIALSLAMLLSFAAATWLLSRTVAAKSTAYFIATCWTIFFAIVAVSGYLISSVGMFGSESAWSLMGLTWTAVAWCAHRWIGALPAAPSRKTLVADLRDGGPLLWVALIAFTAVAVLQLTAVIFVAPHNADSMTYRLVRVAYYLQNGRIDSYDANFWAQVMHPKNSAIGMSFLTLVADRQTNAAQLLQFSSWLTLTLANYSIARRLGCVRSISTLAALCGSLVIDIVMQSNTTQDDLFICALGAVCMASCLEYLSSGSKRPLALIAAAFGLALGTKTSAIPFLLPVALVMVVLVFVRQWDQGKGAAKVAKSVGLIALSTVCGALLLAVPAGYYENYKLYGNALGDPVIIGQKTAGGGSRSGGEGLHNGSVNILRFGLDALNPSGLPRSASAQAFFSSLRRTYISGAKLVGLPLDSAPSLVPPYNADPTPDFAAHEDFSYWGIWAWLILPLSAIALHSRERRMPALCFLVGGGVFIALQAYIAVYDPWRGRYFTQLVAFLVPPFAIGLETVRGYKAARIGVCVLLGVAGISSINAVLHRRNADYFDSFYMPWSVQVTRNTPELQPAMTTIAQRIPLDARVIVSIDQGYVEFPIFGPRLSRHLIPAPDAVSVQQQLLQGKADYLIFDKVELVREGDCELGGRLHIRTLGEQAPSPCHAKANRLSR